MIRFLLVLAVSVAMPTLACASSFYRWTDDEGKMHVTDNPMLVPSELRDDVLANLPDEQSRQRDATEIWESMCLKCHFMGYGESEGKTGISRVFMDKNDYALLETEVAALSMGQVLASPKHQRLRPALTKNELYALVQKLKEEQEQIVANDQSRW